MIRISIFTKIFFFTRFLIKLSVFDQTFRFWSKFRFFDQNFVFDQTFSFWPNFQFLIKISIFWPKFRFWPNFQFLTKLSVFDQNFDFWFLMKPLIFYQIFDFDQTFDFLPEFWSLTKILTKLFLKFFRQKCWYNFLDFWPNFDFLNKNFDYSANFGFLSLCRTFIPDMDFGG